MRKSVLVFLAVLSATGALKAQSVAWHVGVQGGATLGRTTVATDEIKTAALPGWHAGATFELKLPAYFSIQPSVNFEQSRAKAVRGKQEYLSTLKMNYINVPISIQWGPDLGIIRLFVQAVPFADFMLDSMSKAPDSDWKSIDENVNKVQWGTGLGAGVEFWRMQFSFRYNWCFTNWSKTPVFTPFGEMDSYRRSLTLTLAYMFY